MQNKTHRRTSGLWHLKRRGWMGGGPFVVGVGGRLVADCNIDDPEGSYRGPENIDNARFIASAPKMYSLLEEAHELMSSSGCKGYRETGLEKRITTVLERFKKDKKK